MKIASFFSGVGGLELGLEAALGAETVFQVERDPFAVRVLEKHWPGVRRHDTSLQKGADPVFDDARAIPMAREGADADRLNTVFISVDPERDTQQVLADYLANFDPRITGLTGPLAEVERAVAGFRARFEKVTRDGDYTMDHTAGVFLFRADGRFASIIDFHEDRRFALPKIRRVLT